MEIASSLQLSYAVSENLPSTSRMQRVQRFYRPELDMLRFFAFLAVFVHHGIYNVFPILSICGGFGLCFFFFLSAFLITELLQRELELTGTVAIRDFYIRRILRIWPLYFGVLLCSVLFGLAFSSYRLPTLFVLSYIFMLGNLYIGHFGFPTTFIGYLWSISIEEQFYLLWPFLNRKLTRRALTLAVGTLVPIGSVTVLCLAWMGETPAQGIWTNSLVQIQVFAFGALTGLALNGTVPKLMLRWRLILIVIGCALWGAVAALSGIDARTAHSGWGPMVGYWGVGAGCLCFLLSALGVDQKLLPSGLVYLGKISYGLYVFHQVSLELASNLLNRIEGMDSSGHHTVFGVAHLALGMLFTVIISAISYRYFEKTFLRWKDKFTVVRSRLA